MHSKNSSFKASGIIIATLYGATFLGLLFPASADLSLRCYPLVLAAVIIVLAFQHDKEIPSLLLMLSGAFVGGLLVEIFGANSGELLGKYLSGKELTRAELRAPALISVLFALMIYATGQMVQRWPLKRRWQKALAGSLLIILVEVIVEQVTHKLGYWIWNSGQVPIQNYMAWFISAFVMLHFFYAMRLSQQKQIGTILYVSQVAILLGLYIFQ